MYIHTYIIKRICRDTSVFHNAPWKWLLKYNMNEQLLQCHHHSDCADWLTMQGMSEHLLIKRFSLHRTGSLSPTALGKQSMVWTLGCSRLTTAHVKRSGAYVIHRCHLCTHVYCPHSHGVTMGCCHLAYTEAIRLSTWLVHCVHNSTGMHTQKLPTSGVSGPYVCVYTHSPVQDLVLPGVTPMANCMDLHTQYYVYRAGHCKAQVVTRIVRTYIRTYLYTDTSHWMCGSGLYLLW